MEYCGSGSSGSKGEMTSTAHGGKLASRGKKRGKMYANKKADKFRKSQVKRA